MAQAIRRPDDSDAASRPESHPRDRVLAGITFVVGAAGFVFGAIPATHLIGAILGAVAVAVGAYSQMVSETTNERWFNITGVIMGAVGLGLAIGNGGFTL